MDRAVIEGEATTELSKVSKRMDRAGRLSRLVSS